MARLSSFAPKVTVTGNGRGQLRSRGIAWKVPSIYAGMTGAGCSDSRWPTPGRKCCSLPSGERHDSGNQTRLWPRARTLPAIANVARGARSSTGKICAMRHKRRFTRVLNSRLRSPLQNRLRSFANGRLAASTPGSRSLTWLATMR